MNKTTQPETLEEYVDWACYAWLPCLPDGRRHFERAGRHFAVNGSVGFIDDGAASKLLRDEAVRRGWLVQLVQTEAYKLCVLSGFHRSASSEAESELMAVLKACYQAWSQNLKPQSTAPQASTSDSE